MNLSPKPQNPFYMSCFVIRNYNFNYSSELSKMAQQKRHQALQDMFEQLELMHAQIEARVELEQRMSLELLFSQIHYEDIYIVDRTFEKKFWEGDEEINRRTARELRKPLHLRKVAQPEAVEKNESEIYEKDGKQVDQVERIEQSERTVQQQEELVDRVELEIEGSCRGAEGTGQQAD